MFSGIVETVGTASILSKTSDLFTLSIKPNLSFDDVQIGDSVSVNGACLTVTKRSADNFTVDIVPETLKLTNLGNITNGAKLNLERSLKVGSRNGGHNVQGHVDCVGVISKIEKDGSSALIITITVPAHLKKYIVHKGYITVDGMSLTVINVTQNTFSVTLIPHTQQCTIANNYAENQQVNIEVDILGKYLENYTKAYQ